jgi:SNF2 family DNA or RNA helicase
MAVLHGSWSPAGVFWLWAEVWRKVEPYPVHLGQTIPSHPLALTEDELKTELRSLQTSGQLGAGTLDLQSCCFSTLALAIPTSPIKPTKTRRRKSQPDPPLADPANPVNQVVNQVIPHHSGTLFKPDQLPSLSLFPWQVSALCLNPGQALEFLQGLPLTNPGDGDSFMGSDLRLWCHMTRWLLDLLCRSKFLPTLAPVRSIETTETGQDTFEARWQVVLDSTTDRQRLEQFCRQLPLACRVAADLNVADLKSAKLKTSSETSSDTASHTPEPSLANPYPRLARPILHSFLDCLGDAQIRATLTGVGDPKTKTLDPTLGQWLTTLGTTDSTLGEQLGNLGQFKAILDRWALTLKVDRGSQFHTCLTLEAPRSDQDPWQLHFGLQADDDPHFRVEALEIWQHPLAQWTHGGRTITQPQETLLRGLGLAARLYPYLEPHLDRANPHSCQLSPADAYNFIRTVAWKLQDNGLSVVLPPSLANPDNIANRLGLSIQAELTGLGNGGGLGLQNLLKFKWELSLGGQTFTKAKFEKLVAQETPLVQVNGEWLELRPQDVKAAREFFASRKDQPNLSLEDALRISTGDTQTLSKLPVVDFEAAGALQELVTTLTGNQAVEALPAPQGFKGELRPYQARGVGWLSFLHRWNLGACLADDMGLGKTIQFIAFLLHLKAEAVLNHPVLLVCPTSVLGNWEREVKRFGPGLRVTIHHGDKRPKGKRLQEAVGQRHLVITSYALVYRDLQDLKTIAWQGVVLDEAQNIKNAEAKQSQAVRELAQAIQPETIQPEAVQPEVRRTKTTKATKTKATQVAQSESVQSSPRFRIALTGTPVENRLSELWAIMDFLNPGYLGPRNFFQRRFTVPIERYGDTDSLTTLRSLVQPFILRRLKTDQSIIQDLPEKQEMSVFCSLSEEQANLYQRVVNQTMAEIEAAEGIQQRGLVLGLLTKLKQICNHPSLFLKDTGKTKTPQLDLDQFRSRSAKLYRFGEMVEELLGEGDRALIFTQFAEWGKLLQAYLQQWLGREVFFLYGSTKKAQREAMVDRFQLDPQAPPLMILSLKAGGVGLNLTRANHVFHYDRWWNPAVENQATDRAFRIGQTRNVQVHKFVCQGTLEEKVHDLIESKKALAEQVVGAGENWLTDLDTDQLRDLLLLDRSAVIGD